MVLTASFRLQMNRLLRRFYKKKLVDKWIRKKFPRVQHAFVDSTKSLAMDELVKVAEIGNIRCLNRFFATGCISRRDYESYTGFAARLTQLVALHNYRVRKSDFLQTNADVSESVWTEPAPNDFCEAVGDFDLRSFVARCRSHALEKLDSATYRTVCLRSRGSTYIEIGRALNFNRNKASALVSSACDAIGNYLEAEFPPALFGKLLEIEVKRSLGRRTSLPETMSPETYGALIPENPAALLVRRFVEYRCRFRRQRRSEFRAERGS